MENDIQKLYDVLIRDGYYTKSLDEFKNQFEDDNYKQKVYDVTKRDGLYTKSYEEFTSKYSLKKKTFFRILHQIWKLVFRNR
jgi:lipocalin